MEVKYKTKKLMKICEDAHIATKAYGDKMAIKIQLRIDQIKASNDVIELVTFFIGRCHKLEGDRKGQYAMDLVHPYRLIFCVDESSISIAKIEEIVDYH